MIAADDAVEPLGVRDAVTDEEQEAEQDYSYAASHRRHWARVDHHELPTYLVPESDQFPRPTEGDRPPTGPRARPRAYPRNGGIWDHRTAGTIRQELRMSVRAR